MSVLRFLTKVQFENGARALLAEECSAAAIGRALFVTDKGVVAAGVFAQAIESLAVPEAERVFDDTPPNPTEAAALAGAERYRAAGCDGIVAVGGGAALDLAKAIAILVNNTPPLWEFCNRHAAPRRIVAPPPLIVLPTTSGSGSEVGRSAVMVFDNGIKAGIGCPSIVTAAICDPELTVGLPPRITAATGMDAFSHCVETFCSPTVNPPADAIAIDGLTRLSRHIERAVSEGSDGQARWNMMMGSLEGAICFQKGMGAVHALSHPLGAHGYHHGTLNAIFLPHVLAWNADHLGAKRTWMLDALGAPANADLPAVVAGLIARIGLPTRLSQLGVSMDLLEGVTLEAMHDNAHKTNPRPMDIAGYAALFRAAF
jgi:alcohol dehydrogenase class IV